jgi:excisionase family DNA binding protein
MCKNELADQIRGLAKQMLDLSNSLISEEEKVTNNEMSLEEILQDRLDVQEAAALLKCSSKTIYDKVKTGLIPHTRLDNNITFSKKELCKTFNIYTKR